MHLSILGLAAFFLFSLVCPHLAVFSLCIPLSFSSYMAIPLQSFFCNFLGRLHHSCCPSNVFISDLFPPCHSTHPSQHPHLIYFQSCFLSPRCCPGICTIQQSWSDHSFVNLSLQCHRHPPVIQHSTASLPVSHAALTLCVISVVMPPVSSTLAPSYLKRCTRCSSSPRILTGSLPWPLSCPNLKSMNWVFGLLILIPLSSDAHLQVSNTL